MLHSAITSLRVILNITWWDVLTVRGCHHLSFLFVLVYLRLTNIQVRVFFLKEIKSKSAKNTEQKDSRHWSTTEWWTTSGLTLMLPAPCLWSILNIVQTGHVLWMQSNWGPEVKSKSCTDRKPCEHFFRSRRRKVWGSLRARRISTRKGMTSKWIQNLWCKPFGSGSSVSDLIFEHWHRRAEAVELNKLEDYLFLCWSSRGPGCRIERRWMSVELRWKAKKIDESRTYMYVYVSGLSGFGSSWKKVGTLTNRLQDKQTSAPAVKY